jgi:uncharacterized membrane protein YphA (DoxX/SURF4 family)
MLLSLLPQILFLTPAGIALLRIVAGIYFAYMAWHFWKESARMTGISAPIVGHIRSWMLMVGVAVVSMVAILLVLGAWTQVVAIVGALVCIKQLIFFRTFRDYFPFAASTYLLLACMCLVLVVTGSGAFGFDLPL